jgi:hypothetical protein
VLGFRAAQEIQQVTGLATGRAEVDIGYEDAPEPNGALAIIPGFE